MNTSLKYLRQFLLELTVLVPRLVLFLLGLTIGSSVLGIMVLLLVFLVAFQVLVLGVDYLIRNFLPKATTITALLIMRSVMPSSMLFQKKEKVRLSMLPEDLA
jgi:hypothetical protein